MILDKIENYKIYSNLNTRIQEAFEYIKNTDLFVLKTGRHDINENLFVLVNEYTTQDNKENILEAHKKYIDLQYIIKGNELIEYETLNKQQTFKGYNFEEDYILYSSKDKTQLKFYEGMFALFFPDDLHMPGIILNTPQEIRKVVVKILID